MAGISQAKKLIRDKVSQRARPGRSGGALLRQQFQFFDLDGGGGIDRAELKIALQARPTLLGSWDTFQGPSHPDSNEICCMLNHQRRLTLPRPTAAPTATQLCVVLTLRLPALA